MPIRKKSKAEDLIEYIFVKDILSVMKVLRKSYDLMYEPMTFEEIFLKLKAEIDDYRGLRESELKRFLNMMVKARMLDASITVEGKHGKKVSRYTRRVTYTQSEFVINELAHDYDGDL